MEEEEEEGARARARVFRVFISASAISWKP